ncbi:MAG TPA: peptide ABC transporter substrate-binding protein [Bryobacteraceae bacterium]|jgi:peptide/nickel transport system substrate-binding protein|nr:peptide ABC transporter substrate-binding protein [Bryobacteraceae bacterium]
MRLSAGLAFFFVVGCTERAPVPGTAGLGGTVVVSATGDPGSLFPPFVVSQEGKQITEQIYDYLADVGADMNTADEKGYRLGLADRWRWTGDSLELAFHINPMAKWHDGRDVTARDVQFTFALNKNPALGGRLGTELANIDSVTVTDSLTAVFWFHQRLPTQFLDAAAQMLILPAHQLEKIPVSALRERLPPPIGTGRFRLRNWDKSASVEIVADTTNFRGRAKLDRVIWSISPDYTAAVTKVFAGDADVFDGLRPEDLSKSARHPSVRPILLPGMDYAFLRFNLRDPANKSRPHPLFGNRDLRRAITMSLNRATLVRSLLDTFALVPVGPTVRAYAVTDPRGAQLPFDSVRASRLLDSLGWLRRGADGTRAKNGKPLSFSIIIPTHSRNRMKMGPLMQEQLRRMGVRVQLELLEKSTENDRESRGVFDAALGGWTMGSSPDGIKGAWTTQGIGSHGVNYGSYSNPVFDALLDSALKADPAVAREKFTRAFAVINDDAPAVWLYEPRKIVGVNKRIRTTKMRPDAWWFDLAEWYIPSTEQLPRDRIPLSR